MLRSSKILCFFEVVSGAGELWLKNLAENVNNMQPYLGIVVRRLHLMV